MPVLQSVTVRSRCVEGGERLLHDTTVLQCVAVRPRCVAVCCSMQKSSVRHDLQKTLLKETLHA